MEGATIQASPLQSRRVVLVLILCASSIVLSLGFEGTLVEIASMRELVVLLLIVTETGLSEGSA